MSTRNSARRFLGYQTPEFLGKEKVVKTLRIIPKADVDKFMRKIAIIAGNPYASLSFVKRLKNSQNFRFRFGDYRGVYNVTDKILTITVIDVAHRKDIYRG